LENNRAEQVLPGSEWGLGWQVVQTMYTYVSKCKTGKIKFKKEIKEKIITLPNLLRYVLEYILFHSFLLLSCPVI
jgi:hypothetical protein